MSRPVRIAVALALALSLAAPGPGLAAEAGAYEHVWAAQTLFSGEAGQSEQSVLESSVVLSLESGTYSGQVTFADLLGVATDEGVTSQESAITLSLTGTPLEGGSAAGGTFSGSATLALRTTDDLEEAVSSAIREREGDVAVYEVSGHWGARIEGGVAAGEIIYERVTLREGVSTVQSPSAFNRASLANPDGLGDAQLFSVAVEGIAAADGGDGANGEGIEAGGEGGSAAGPGAEAAAGPSVLDYILKGLRGERLEVAVPVPGELAAAGRALLDARPAGATPLPGNALAVDVHVAGAYLDAKNRAAGLLAEDGPRFDGAGEARAAASAARAAVPGIQAVPADADAGVTWATRSIEALADQTDVAGSAELAEELRLVRPGADRARVLALRVRALAIEAIGADAPYGSVLAGAANGAAAVRDGALSSGSASDAVLAAADDPRAPSSATEVRGFARDASLDTSGTTSAEASATAPLPERAMAANDGRPLAYASSAGPVRLAPEIWQAHRRADGVLYWLAGADGDVALTDGSVRGWAFETPRAALVDAGRSGRVVAVLPVK